MRPTPDQTIKQHAASKQVDLIFHQELKLIRYCQTGHFLRQHYYIKVPNTVGSVDTLYCSHFLSSKDGKIRIFRQKQHFMVLRAVIWEWMLASNGKQWLFNQAYVVKWIDFLKRNVQLRCTSLNIHILEPVVRWKYQLFINGSSRTLCLPTQTLHSSVFKD